MWNVRTKTKNGTPRTAHNFPQQSLVDILALRKPSAYLEFIEYYSTRFVECGLNDQRNKSTALLAEIIGLWNA